MNPGTIAAIVLGIIFGLPLLYWLCYRCFQCIALCHAFGVFRGCCSCGKRRSKSKAPDNIRTNATLRRENDELRRENDTLHWERDVQHKEDRGDHGGEITSLDGETMC